MGRPGIMLYFDIRQPLQVLPMEEKGRLFDAILEYGEFGTVPDFDGMLAMAWGFIQPRLDRDGENYENTIAQRKYAAFCKKIGNTDVCKPSFEEWKEATESERERMLTVVGSRYPTTTTRSTSSISSSITTATAATAGAGVGRSGRQPMRSYDEDRVDFEKMRQEKIQMLDSCQ